MKIDITTGDIIIPKEIDYSYGLMFEEGKISIKAYNLDTILAEKIESILARNIANTRARDYYDVYILLVLRKNEVNIENLRDAIWKKAEERNALLYLENKEKYLKDIKESEKLNSIWISYTMKYSYAQGINLIDVIKLLENIILF